MIVTDKPVVMNEVEVVPVWAVIVLLSVCITPPAGGLKSPAFASSVTPEGIITLLALAPVVGALIVFTIISLAIYTTVTVPFTVSAALSVSGPAASALVLDGIVVAVSSAASWTLK